VNSAMASGNSSGRGSGACGRWHGINNVVHHTTIVHLGGRGQNGAVTGTPDESFWDEANNPLDRNIYIVADRTNEFWTSNDRDGTWDDLEELGIERHGELTVEQRTPMQLSCDDSFRRGTLLRPEGAHSSVSGKRRPPRPDQVAQCLISSST
jgi:hypothetical protein